MCKESKYIDIKNYKVTSNRNGKPNKKRIYKSNEYIEMRINIHIIYIYTYIYIYIYIYIYTNIKINKYKEMHVEKSPHTCEEGGHTSRISFWHLLMNLKNK